jgi:DSF synthase
MRSASRRIDDAAPGITPCPARLRAEERMTKDNARLEARRPGDFPDWRFDHLDIRYEETTRSFWMEYKATAPHYFPLEMFMEIVAVRRSLLGLIESDRDGRWPIRYFVIASRRPGVFGLGGDLGAFAAAVRARQAEALRAHAEICVDIMHGLATGFELPIVTLSAVHGQCLGGAFEGALVTDFLIAEEDARLGLPEIAFNTFPGMGAVSLLERRLPGALAQRIVSGGEIYTGREMYDLGVVHALAPPGGARAAARQWMAPDEALWRRRHALVEARRVHYGVTRAELSGVVNAWVECVLGLSEHDLRHLDRLVAAQKRLRAQQKENAGTEPALESQDPP